MPAGFDDDATRPRGTSFTVNGRTYHPPSRPVVVICIDGCADEYLSTSLAHGCMPNVARMITRGYRGLARAALPTFTNVNNACIVTGVPPSETGICGNYFLERETGEEVMMNSARYLRAETISAAAARAGRHVGVVTAKEKLRELLCHRLTGCAFSAEKAHQAIETTHRFDSAEELVGQTAPSIYSAEASLFVLRAGVRLLEEGIADFLYLSLTDYVEHKHSPHARQSLVFFQGIDCEIGRLLELGAVVAATADHGMNAKNTPDGEPNVIYLETLLTERFGGGVRVICPITDPYVRHHAGLGSAVMVYLPEALDGEEVRRWALNLDGVSEVYDRSTAAAKLELPEDRVGDLVVLSERDVALGRTPADHDLGQLEGGLRSHGGRYEQMVPILLSEPLTDAHLAHAAGDLRNFDIYDLVCNGVRA